MNTEQDNEHSRTTQESVVDDECRQELQQTQELVVDDERGQEQQQQEDIEAVIVREDDKDNEKQKESDDTQAWNKELEQDNLEQDNEQSTTTQESVVDDENEADIIGDDHNDNEEHDIRSTNEEQQEQVENEDDFEAREQDEGCSSGTKKRRQFTLQEKLMYFRVIWQKVDKGLSLWEASKSINISHKQILDWKKQVGKMRSKTNQHAKSLGDGVTSFLSPYTDNLLSFIFKMRETGMAVSVNSIVLEVSQLSREFREKTYTARHSAMHQFIIEHGFEHWMGTHLSQRQPSEMEEIATDFVCVTWEKLQMSCRDEAYIINIDNTPVPFSYDPKTIIEVVG